MITPLLMFGVTVSASEALLVHVELLDDANRYHNTASFVLLSLMLFLAAHHKQSLMCEI